MSTDDHQSRSAAFDPYGEPIESGREFGSWSGDRRARRLAAAVFWSLALLLLAGRIYLDPTPAARGLAFAKAQIATLVAIF